jgi:hypothetical protein
MVTGYGYGVWLRAWLRALRVGTDVAAGIVAGVVTGLAAGVMRIKRRNFIEVLSLSVPISYLPKSDIGSCEDKTLKSFSP